MGAGAERPTCGCPFAPAPMRRRPWPWPTCWWRRASSTATTWQSAPTPRPSSTRRPSACCARGQQQVAVLGRAAGAAKPYDECEKPALEGEYEVNGVKCRTAFEVFKEHIEAMTPEWAEEITTARRHPCARWPRSSAPPPIGETIEIEQDLPPPAQLAVDIFSGLLHKHSILNVWASPALNTLIGHELRGWLHWLRHEMPRLGRQQPTAGFDLGIWEEDGFIECNSLMISAPNSFLQDHPRALTPHLQGLLGCSLTKTAASVHMAMADPDLYHDAPAQSVLVRLQPHQWWANVEEQVKVYQTWTSSSAWTSI